MINKEFLKKFTSKPRVAGHKSDLWARKMIIAELRKLNKKYYLQNFPFLSWENLHCQVLLENREVPSLPLMWSGSGSGKGYLESVGRQATFSGAYYFDKFSLDDEKIYLLSRDDQVWMQPLDQPQVDEVFVMIFPDELEKIKKNPRQKITVNSQNKFWPSNSANIICPTPEKAKLLLTAHYDSVPHCPGANDNASGVITLLEIMKNFPGEEIEYIFFGAEEWNLSGSRYWVKQSNPQKFPLAINIDMVAGRGSTISLFATEDIYPSVKKIFPELEVELGIFSCWDSHSLAQRNIPTVQITSKPYAECHFPQDTIEKLDFSQIDRVIDVVEALL